MRHNACVIEVLLAGPSDVEKDLRIVRDGIADWNAAHSRSENTFLEAVHWDTHSIPEIGDRPQALLNHQIVERCDLLIAIFWKSIGTPTGIAESGTLEEIDNFRTSGRPVMIYFSEAPIPQKADLSSFKRLKKYRKTLDKTLYRTFKSSADLRKLVAVHLPQAVTKIKTSANSKPRESSAPKPRAESSRLAKPSVKLNKFIAQLNRIESELLTTRTINEFPEVIRQLRPLLLNIIELPKVTRIETARKNLESLVRRVAALEEFTFHSNKVADFEDERSLLFEDIRRALRWALQIETMNKWEDAYYRRLKAKARSHTSEGALNWPPEKQCQCRDCRDFRQLMTDSGFDPNNDFRSWVLTARQEIAKLRNQPGFDEREYLKWLSQSTPLLQKIAADFRSDNQSENAERAERAIQVLKSVAVRDFSSDFFKGPIEFEREIAKPVETAVNDLAGML